MLAVLNSHVTQKQLCYIRYPTVNMCEENDNILRHFKNATFYVSHFSSNSWADIVNVVKFRISTP